MVFNLFKSGYNKIYNALGKTRKSFSLKLRQVIGKAIDDDAIDAIEELLYEADLGTDIADSITDRLREGKSGKSPDEVINTIKQELLQYFELPKVKTEVNNPQVILIVGVNGNGKTTSIAKLAKHFQSNGKKVLVGAADTFRAAAIEQMNMWAKKIGVDIVKGSPGSDPAAVAFDTVSAAVSRKQDIVLIDTAGRLQTKKHLMHELEKIKRSCHKVLPGTPNETYLVLDATSGQNAIEQAKVFHEYTPLSGIILSKLDGSAKGGVALSIVSQLQIPIKYIGIGEKEDDLEPFNAEAFVNGLLGIE